MMQVQDGLRNDLLPAMSGAPCRASECSSAAPARSADSMLKQRACSELGVRLGLDFSDITSALRAMVARSGAAGVDAVPDVLRSIDAALEDTGRALRRAGFSEEQVGKALDSVRESLGASAAAGAEITAAQSTTYMRKDKANLAITTQEGDRVQIRFRSREGVVSQTSSSATGEERRVYAFSSGRIEISVQGELNDDELAAISELVDKVESLASDFFAGDVQKAFEAAASLGFDSEQIAGFALKLSTRERLEQCTTGAPRPAAAPCPPAAPSIAAPTAEESAPTTDDAAAPATTAAAPAAPAATDAAGGGGATAPASTESVQSTLSSYLRRVLGTLADAGAGAGRFEFSMKWKLEVVVAAVKAQAPTPAGTPASNLLTGSLQALGEQLDAQPATAATSTAAKPATAAA